MTDTTFTESSEVIDSCQFTLSISYRNSFLVFLFVSIIGFPILLQNLLFMFFIPKSPIFPTFAVGAYFTSRLCSIRSICPRVKLAYRLLRLALAANLCSLVLDLYACKLHVEVLSLRNKLLAY
jgi:hypothetical protein